MKRFLTAALLFFILLTFPALSSAQTNQVSLTTYYPAPFGAYDRVRLVPRPDFGSNTCSSNEKGTLYFPNSGAYDGTILFCDKNGNWSPLTGGIWDMTSISDTGGNWWQDYFDVAPSPRPDIDQYSPAIVYSNLTTKLPYLGIGTATPQRPLHIAIQNPNVETLLALENKYIGAGSGTGISFRGVDTTSANTPFTEIGSIETTYAVSGAAKKQSTMDFSVANGNTGNIIKTLTLWGNLGGKVGILTPNPNGLLEITGNGTSNSLFQITSAGGQPNGNYFQVLNNGKVGIGVLNPAQKLEINGNVKMTALILTSDNSLKKEIVPVNNALDKISRLNGVSFEWKDSPEDQRKHMGVIAQDVEKVFPEAVYGTDGSKGVDYPSLIAPLIEAVKELRQQNESLSQQLHEQSTEIQLQKEKINSLESSRLAQETPPLIQ